MNYLYVGYDLSGVSVEQNGSALQQFGYEYDASKNIIERSQNGNADQFGYDSLNRVASEMAAEESKIYNYDANGNRDKMGSGKIFGMKNAEYTYDSINRLTKVSVEGKEVTYSYNGDGLLYERTADSCLLHTKNAESCSVKMLSIAAIAYATKSNWFDVER
ncbi:RHS repeat domain-containing protein [Paenibacillus enshidis]|uniref:RHS repeat domain-containing protein n=1 Tax=Paenibacillus enshidis TaxID=1458439 RepID=A0ABV5AWG4_9BACL